MIHRLRAENVTLGYDRRTIVDGLDVVIPDRSFTVIVGANGCGKSTLLRGLARMLKPASGTVHLDGQEIRRLPSKEVARRLGLLPQGPVAPDASPSSTSWPAAATRTKAPCANGRPTTKPPSTKP